MEPEPAPDDVDELFSTALREVIANEVMSQVANKLERILSILKEDFEQLFRAATTSAQGRVCTVVYYAVQHVILDQIRLAVAGKTTNTHFDQCYEAGKAGKALGKRLPRNDDLLAPIASFVQTQATDAITDQRRVIISGSTSL